MFKIVELHCDGDQAHIGAELTAASDYQAAKISARFFYPKATSGMYGRSPNGVGVVDAAGKLRFKIAMVYQYLAIGTVEYA